MLGQWFVNGSKDVAGLLIDDVFLIPICAAIDLARQLAPSASLPMKVVAKYQFNERLLYPRRLTFE